MNFERLSIFIPGFLRAEREERRVKEAIAEAVLKPVIYFFPTLLSVPVETVAKATVGDAAKQPDPSGVEIYDNKQIHKLAKESY